jgi:uncharacterized protein YifE (UPF0438 family)
MSNLTRDQLVRKPFNDYKNYPYGFTRSGDFSIKEAGLLEKHGSLFLALTNGDISPANDDDKKFLEIINDVGDTDNDAFKIWVKYLKKINRQKVVSIYGGRKSDADEDDLAPASTSEVELDDD